MTMQISLISLSVQILTLAALLALSVKLIRESGRNMTAVFWSFYLALWLLGDLYWLIYDLMRPEIRMPFAANEIGEAALFLFLAATINSARKHHTNLPFGYLAGTLFFALSNMILWIMWSGEIVQDVVSGAIFAWLFYCIVRSLRSEQVLTKAQWILLCIICCALIASEALTFVVSEDMKNVPDFCGYMILIAGTVFFVYMLIRAYRRGQTDALLFLSFSLSIWLKVSLYMSADNWYNLYLTLETPGVLLCYLAVRKAVRNV